MSSPLDRDIVILNPGRDNYVGLDEIGRRIWDLLAVPREVRSLSLQLAQEFQEDPTRIAADILTFLDELATEGLVDVAAAGFH